MPQLMSGMAAFAIQTMVTAKPSPSPGGVVPGMTSSERGSARVRRAASRLHRQCPRETIT